MITVKSERKKLEQLASEFKYWNDAWHNSPISSDEELEARIMHAGLFNKLNRLVTCENCKHGAPPQCKNYHIYCLRFGIELTHVTICANGAFELKLAPHGDFQMF